MKYVVEITESLVKHVVVDANSMRKAEDKAQKAHTDSKIVLDYSDYEDVDFKCLRKADEDDIADYVDVEDL